MARRVLITSAGTGEANNLVRSLRAGDGHLSTVGCHADPFVLRASSADRNYLTPPARLATFPDALGRVIEREAVDLVVPSSDADVAALSAIRGRLSCRTLLPAADVIDRCQDKYALTTFLRARGVPAPLTFPVGDAGDAEAIFRRMAPRTRLWCRIRAGTGSRGAIAVATAEQAMAWIRYWEQMRGVPASAFTLSEYLPGRDFACQSVWKDGRLVVVKTCERLSYHGGASRASGVSSTPALAKTVVEPGVVDVCRAAIRALDASATGVFAVDLKEDADGVPCVTEINAGRFFMITNIFDLTGRHNTALTYVRLALGEQVDVAEAYDATEDHYLVRDLDNLPRIVHADRLYEGIEDLEEDAVNAVPHTGKEQSHER